MNDQQPNKPGRIKYRQRINMRFKTRIVIAAASFAFLIAGTAIIYLNLGVSHETRAAVLGDYRSLMSGNWGIGTTWERFDGTSWLPTLVVPTSAVGTITIQSGHTVTIAAGTNADQLVVESGGTLTIVSALNVINGAGNDIKVSGTMNLKTGGTINMLVGSQVEVLNGGTYNYSGGTQTATGWVINNGGTYIHNVNNINIPTATWGATSTIKITGITSNDLQGLTQSFGNFIYDCPSQTAIVEFRDQLGSIQGNFTVISTGTGNIFLQRISTATPVTISGNYLQTGGTVYATKGAAFTLNIGGTFTINAGTFIEVERYGAPVMNIYGVFTINGGTFDHSTYNNTNANEGIGIVNLYNNYLRTGGLHTETSVSIGRGDFNFAKSGTQTFVHTGGSITNTVNFTVNSGSVLDLSTYMVTGGGSFTLNSGGGLIMASTAGISSSGATGNVQVTGPRSFSTGGDYTYNATSAQLTGSGLPATIHNLTINNVSDVTMSGSSSATNIITLTNGRVITGSYVLGITNTDVNSIVNYSETNYVVGNCQRSVASTGAYDFPVGTMAQYELANLTFTAKTGFTDVLASFVNANPINPEFPLTALFVNGTPIGDMLDYGYWTLTPNSPMTGGIYSVTLNEKGHTNGDNPNKYAVLKRNSVNSFWESKGTHFNETQSEINGVAVAKRSELNAFSHFGIGKGNGPLPVTLVDFKAKPIGNTVECKWQTLAEVNNDYFTLERSKNGKQFIEVARIDGQGYSSSGKKYSYIDKHPMDGISYYRLKQTDYDGHFEIFQVVTVNMDVKQVATGTLSIRPNPFEEEFTTQFDATESGEAKAIISTLSGTIVYSQNITVEEGHNEIQLSLPGNVRAGTYVLRVVNEVLELPAVKIIKK